MTSTQRVAVTWYVYGYVREVVLIFPVYAIMMGEHGVSPIQLSILFLIWSASALIFEVPSGVLADRYSRKRLLVAAAVIRGSAFVVWWVLPEFAGYLVGFVVWSVGSSLVSGTSESFLYDTLRAQRRVDDGAFARVYGRGMVANSLGVATAPDSSRRCHTREWQRGGDWLRSKGKNPAVGEPARTAATLLISPRGRGGGRRPEVRDPVRC